MTALLCRATAVLVAIATCVTASASAHDLPNDVTIQVFLKAEGPRLTLLVRAPMAAMQDVDYPHRGDGWLDLAHADAALRDAARLWLVPNLAAYEGTIRLPAGRVVAARVSLPSDRSFTSWDAARALVSGPPLASETTLTPEQGLLDVALEMPIASGGSSLAIEPAFARLGIRVRTVVRFVTAAGAVRAFDLPGDPGVVRLDPSWSQAAARFVRSGFDHILGGADHLLFLLCLVIPVRRLRPLVFVVTAFTLAHSMALLASAMGVVPDALWFPPLVETLIAASIVYMALENIASPHAPHRALVAFGFGLVHGFGFSFALRESLQFAGPHLLASLVAFNVGVELGQLAVLVLLVPLLQLAFRHVVAERVGTILLSALVAHTGWHWTIERLDRLRQFRLAWPVFDAAWFAGALRGAMLLVVVGGLAWALREWIAKTEDRRQKTEGEVGG